MLNGDRVQGFERVDWAKRLAVLLRDGEPLGTVGRVRWLVHASRDLLLDDLADFVVDAGRNRDITFDPRYVGYDGELDGREEVFAEPTSLGVVPGESVVV